MPRRVEIDQLLPGSPEQVQERLKGETRFSVQPSRGNPFTLGDKKLKGVVGKDSARVGLNRRDWWSMLQPTARVTLESTASGTRMKGEAGLPGWMTWLLRGVVVGGIPAAVGVSTAALLADGSPGTTAIAAGFAGFAALVGIFGTGAHVHHADEQVDDLKNTLIDVAGGQTAEQRVAAVVGSAAADGELDEAMRQADAGRDREREEA